MTNRFAKELNDMTQITPQPGIMDIALYQGGAAHVVDDHWDGRMLLDVLRRLEELVWVELHVERKPNLL